MMNRTVPTIALFLSTLFTLPGWAQGAGGGARRQAPPFNTAQDTVDVQHVMDAFHDAVVSHDSARLSALFLPEGSTWLNVLSAEAYARAKAKKPDVAKVRVSSYKDFAKLLSSSQAAMEPKHSNLQIHSDGTIAAVYFDFSFLINGKEENRGAETWQLVNDVDGWRIAAITYSSSPVRP